MGIVHRPKIGPPFYYSRDIYIYLQSACHDKQHGDQSFNLRARIAELWRFKTRKVEKTSQRKLFSHLEACEQVFSDAAKNGTVFSRN